MCKYVFNTSVQRRVFIIRAVLFTICLVFATSLVRSNGKQHMTGTSQPAGTEWSGRVVETSLEGTTRKVHSGETVHEYSESKLENSPTNSVRSEKSDAPACERWAVLQSLHQAGYTFPEVTYRSIHIPRYVPMHTQSTKRDTLNDESCKTSRSLTFWTTGYAISTG